MSTNRHWHQLSSSRNPPNLGGCEERSFIQCKQLNCDSAQLWDNSAVFQLSFEAAQLWVNPQERPLSSQTALPLWPILPARETQSEIFHGKGKCTVPASTEQTYTGRNPRPWSLIGSFSCKGRLQILVGWLVQKALSWLVKMKLLWLVSNNNDGYSRTALIGWGKPQSYWLKQDSRTPFIRAAPTAEYSAWGQLDAGCSLLRRGACVEMAGRSWVCFFLIWAQLATRSISS